MTVFYLASKKRLRRVSAFAFMLSLLLLTAFPLSAFAVPETEAADNGVVAHLPIEITNNRVHVVLELFGTPVRMLLDTGASSTILFKNPGFPQAMLSAGEVVDIHFPAFRSASTGYRLPTVTYGINGFSFTSTKTLYIENRDQILPDLNARIEGILGRDFFDSFIVEVVPSELRMVLLAHGSKLRERFRYRHPIHMDGGSPYLLHRSRLPWENQRTPKKLLLDTGYPGGIVLWDEAHFNKATRPDERQALLAENKGILYYGLVRFGKLIFKNIPIFIGPNAPDKTDGREGIIGASMLLPFRYAIDFKRKNLWLSPRVRSFSDHYQISNEIIYTPGNEDFIVKEFPPRMGTTPKLVLPRNTEIVPE